MVGGWSSFVVTGGRLFTPRRILRGVGTVLLVALAVLVVVGLAPFALRERPSSGAVADTAAALTGQAQEATDGLRGLGYSCSDPITTPETVTRSCSRVRSLTTSQVQLAVATPTGLVQLVRASIHQGRSSAAAHRDVLDVLARAVSLQPAERAQVVAAATAVDEETVLPFGWGTAIVRTGDTPDSTLRAAGGPGPGPGLRPSPTTFGVPVNALAAAAQAHGYTCTTPQVRTIRSCQRSDGDYHDDLWLQGTDTYTTSVYLSVSSIYHTRTRSHWVKTMTQTLNWVNTDQTRALGSWLAGSDDAPGAASYVDGLRISFLVRNDEWTKETFGGITTECAPTVDDISSCDP